MEKRFLRRAQLRSELRHNTKLRVKVVGIDSTGTVFSEETQTENVSGSGVCMILGCHVAPGDKIGVVGRDGYRSTPLATFEVRWTSAPIGRHMMVGARLVDGGDWQSWVRQRNVRFN